MSDLAEKHLTTDICFKVRDNRGRGNISDSSILALAGSVHFNGTSLSNGILLRNITRTEDGLLTSVRKLRTVLPNVVAHEAEESIKYKVNHGSLQDESSFADIWDPQYKLYVLSSRYFSEITACRTTSIN